VCARAPMLFLVRDPYGWLSGSSMQQQLQAPPRCRSPSAAALDPRAPAIARHRKEAVAISGLAVREMLLPGGSLQPRSSRYPQSGSAPRSVTRPSSRRSRRASRDGRDLRRGAGRGRRVGGDLPAIGGACASSDVVRSAHGRVRVGLLRTTGEVSVFTFGTIRTSGSRRAASVEGQRAVHRWGRPDPPPPRRSSV